MNVKRTKPRDFWCIPVNVLRTSRSIPYIPIVTIGQQPDILVAPQANGMTSSACTLLIKIHVLAALETLCKRQVWYGMVWYGMVWYGMVEKPLEGILLLSIGVEYWTSL